MKKFIFKLVGFIIFFCISICLFVFITAQYLNNRASFKIKQHIRYAVFGPSLPECAFDDSIISNFKNCAQSGESYYYTYFKIKKIIEQNPHVETVFVELINNEKEDNRDITIWGDKYISNRVPIYLPFMRYEDYKVLVLNNFTGFINSLSLYLRDDIKRILSKDLNYSDEIGGFQHLIRDKTDSLLKAPSVFKPTAGQNSSSVYNSMYLDKILFFCRKQNKKVFMIRTPLHSQSPETKHEKLLQKTLDTKYAEFEFLDFKNFPVLNSEFGDLEHLNYRGARKFSIWFDNLLKEGLLEVTNKQQLINQKILEINNTQ